MLCLALEGRKRIAQNYMQWIASITTALLMMQAGIVNGWASPNVARYTKNSSEIVLSADEVSWVSSVKDLAGIFGTLAAPFSLEHLGPKPTGQVAFVIFLLSWTSLLVAKDFLWLMISRTLGGLAYSVTFLYFPVYVGEISSPKVRGTLIAIALNGGAPGLIIASVLETYYPATTCVPVYLVHCLTGLALLTFLFPESPYFLVKSGKLEEARASIRTYFPGEKLDDKLNEMQCYLKRQASKENNGLLSNFASAHTRKLLLLMMALVSLVEFVGLVNIQRYMQSILERANARVIEPESAVMYINSLNFAARLITCNLVDAIGRKPLSLFASLLVSSSMAGLGLYFFVLDSIIHLEYTQWVPIICIVVFRLSYSVGFSTVIYALLSELCPVDSKILAGCLSNLSLSCIDFFLAKVYLTATSEFGEEYVFWFHATCALLVIPFVFFLIPETKGKKLEEI